MNIITSIGQQILNILLTDNSLTGINFYEGYSANRITVPVKGVMACVLVKKCELKGATAGGLVVTGGSGFLGEFSVEIAVYSSIGAGGFRCADAMGDIAEAILKSIPDTDLGLTSLKIVPVDYDGNLRAFKGSVIFDLTACTQEEAEP